MDKEELKKTINQSETENNPKTINKEKPDEGEENLKTNERIQVEINGEFYNCSIIKEPLYDPSGMKMRS